MSATAIDTVRAFITALETNDQDTAESYLSDNFIFSGWTPRPLNKSDFLTVMGGLKAGIPGLIFNLHNIEEQGNTVTGTMQIAGYQSDSFILPPLGLPPIPQMARSISMPTEDVTFIIANNQLTRFNVQQTASGGLRGLLHQLGFDAPIIQ